jgi:ABC-type antimicrobial peptide transport system permease subunit
MHQDDANAFFKTEGMTSQFLVYGRTGSPKTLSAANIRGLRPGKRISLHVKDRNRSREFLQSGFDHKGGIFIVLLVVGGALAISAFLVTSGLGLREADKEIGVLKAMGWRRVEILEKIALENLIISLLAVSTSVLFSMVWIKGLNGVLIAQFYIAEVGLFPEVGIPSRYLPSHALLGLAFTLVVSLVGGLSTAWKKAGRTPHTLVRS